MRKQFTTKEDAKLCSLVAQYGDDKWNLVASGMKARTPKQCRDRWKNYLSIVNPNFFTKGEDQFILDVYCTVGPKWTLISKHLNRTSLQIRNRYHEIKKQCGQVPLLIPHLRNQKTNKRESHMFKTTKGFLDEKPDKQYSIYMKKHYERSVGILDQNKIGILDFSSQFVAQGFQRDDICNFVSCINDEFQIDDITSNVLSKSNFPQFNIAMTRLAGEHKNEFTRYLETFISENGQTMNNSLYFKQNIYQLIEAANNYSTNTNIQPEMVNVQLVTANPQPAMENNQNDLGNNDRDTKLDDILPIFNQISEASTEIDTSFNDTFSPFSPDQNIFNESSLSWLKFLNEPNQCDCSPGFEFDGSP